jgi:WD40 repeat protein
VDILWTTGTGPDPALRQVFAADRPAAVATAVVDGVDVLVTVTDEHEDFDCDLGSRHVGRCPGPGLRIWDRATGTLIRVVPDVCDNGIGEPAVLVTTEVDGRPVAVVRDWARPPKVIDLGTGRRLGALPGHDDAKDVQDIATVGPAVVTVGWDGMLRVTDPDSGRTTTVDTGERLNAVAVVRVGGRAVAVTGRDTLTLWDPADGSSAGTLAPVDGLVPATIVGWPGDDPTVAVLGTNGTITVWNAETGDRRVVAGRLAPRPWGVAALTGADGRPMLGIDNGETVTLWDVHTGEPFGAPLRGPVSHGRMLADGPGTLLVASAGDDAISVWRFAAERPHAGSALHADVRCLTVTPDGEIVAGGSDGVLSRWRAADGTREPDLGRLPGRVNTVAAVHRHLLAAGGDLHEITDDTLHRWVDGLPQRAVTLDHRGQVDVVLPFHLDGEPAVVTAGCDGGVRLTRIHTGLHLGSITDAYPPRGVAVGLLDGRPAAAICGMFGPFTVWDLAGRTEIGTPAAANVEIGEAARGWVDTGAGPTVITVHESVVRMHNLRTGAVSELQPGHDMPVTALAASEDPAVVAIARMDGTVSVADPATGRTVGVLRLPHPVRALAWAPGRRLVMACRRDLYCAEVPTGSAARDGRLP